MGDKLHRNMRTVLIEIEFWILVFYGIVFEIFKCRKPEFSSHAASIKNIKEAGKKNKKKQVRKNMKVKRICIC